MGNKRRMIDPPSGYLFGFPREFTGEEGQSIDEWLVQHGYPQYLVDQFPDGVPCQVYFSMIDVDPIK